MTTHSSVLAWRIHGQRSLMGYSPWGCKEADTTKATEQVLMQSAGMTRNSSWKKFYIIEGRDVNYFLPLKKF